MYRKMQSLNETGASFAACWPGRFKGIASCSCTWLREWYNEVSLNAGQQLIPPDGVES